MIIEANIKAKDFSYSKTVQWQVLQQRFTTGLTIKELTSIAVIIREVCPELPLKKMKRETKRNLTLLVQWFIENWNSISPILPYITLYDDNGNEINSSAEIQTLRYRPRQAKDTL